MLLFMFMGLLLVGRGLAAVLIIAMSGVRREGVQRVFASCWRSCRGRSYLLVGVFDVGNRDFLVRCAPAHF